MSSSIKAPSSAPAQASHHLELLSNTAMLKKVMDTKLLGGGAAAADVWRNSKSAEQTPASKEAVTVKVNAASPPPPTLLNREVTPTEPSPFNSPVVATAGLYSSKALVEHPTPPLLSPPHSTTVAKKVGGMTMMGGTTPTVGVGIGNRLSYGSPASSYASLLAPTASASTQAQVHAAAAAAAHHRLAIPTLAHLPPSMQMAMMASAAATNNMYGGPSSAFQKPPPYFTMGGSFVQQRPVTVTASPSMDSLHASSSPTPPGATGAMMADHHRAASFEALVQENLRLKQEAKQKDDTIASLSTKADGLEKQIVELRQLPTGKISHIPIEDMMRIMQDYGSEVSNQTLPKRKQPIQKASIVRQFRRWNPEFFRYFVHVNGAWVPRLGRAGEMKRRTEKRRTVMKAAAGTSGSTSTTTTCVESPDQAKSGPVHY